jgi:predicted O-linked N-acetylglucosamine transferase (SPINDLY family)
MNLLRDIDGSVLWLRGPTSYAEANLKLEAQAQGVNPKRIIFAPRVELAEHLARHNLADLFLDTTPYNAHTTATEALWAGLPVITYLGESFPGRVAASVLRAAGLPELATSSLKEYEDLARDLAQSPQRLAGLKAKLRHNRTQAPLFDMARFTRNLEAAYAMMWERHQMNLPPENLEVVENLPLV